MRIVIASDSFKGTNSSMRVASLIEEGAARVFPEAEFVKLPIADGGEGTVDSLVKGLDELTMDAEVADPLGRPVSTYFGIIGNHAVLEMASANGLTLLSKDELNPLATSTYGTGQLIVAALEAGFTDITIGIGGSATNDGGAGMATALGYRFLDINGKELPFGGAPLAAVAEIDDTNVHELLTSATIHIACDVDNPLLGEQGASQVYGPQKGATPQMVQFLDAALGYFADITEEWKGCQMRDIPGAGAAGGLGFGLMAFCDAQMRSGIDTILDLIDFEAMLSGANLVITGEGRIDGQSIHGKVPIGVASRAKKHRIPVLAIIGDIGQGASAVYDYGIDALMSTVDRIMPFDEAMNRSQECLVDAAERACRILRMGLSMADLNPSRSHLSACE